MSALLEVSELSKDFTTRSGLFRKKIHQAVKPVSFSLEAGQTIGFIGPERLWEVDISTNACRYG